MKLKRNICYAQKTLYLNLESLKINEYNYQSISDFIYLGCKANITNNRRSMRIKKKEKKHILLIRKYLHQNFQAEVQNLNYTKR